MGIRVSGDRARALPGRSESAPEVEEERPGRHAPLRLRVRPPSEDGVLDEFDFAAEVVDVVTAHDAGGDPSAELAPGQLYAARYRVEEVLGRTHGAHRYSAIQEPLVRRVVLTVLRGDASDDATVALESRFLREAGVLSRMRHPSLAPVHEAGRSPAGTCFATEELLYGFTLRDLIDRGSLGPDRLVAIAADIAGALAALHEAGVPHRCLRVDQVVVGPRIWRAGAGAEVAQVGRYGLEVTPEDVIENLDPEAAVAWAPEVLRGEEPDESADIYSLGVILYRALAGRAPYPGTASEVMGARTLADPPALVRDRDGGLADKLRDVTDRCLQAAPERRYPSARALLAVLEELAQAPKVVAVAPVPVRVHVPAPPQALPLRGLLMAAFAGAFVPTVAVLALLFRTSGTPGADTPGVDAPRPGPVATAPVVVAAPVVAPVAPPVEAAPAPEASVVPAAAPATPSPEASRRTREPAPSRAPVAVRPGAKGTALEPVVLEPAVAPAWPPVATTEPVVLAAVAAEPRVAPVEAPEAARAESPVVVVPGAAALSGLWLGKVSGGSFALDIAVAPDGRVTGRARRSDGASEGTVAGRVSTSEDGLRVELQVTEGADTTSYSGGVLDGELRGRIYAGGKAQGRFTARR